MYTYHICPPKNDHYHTNYSQYLLTRFRKHPKFKYTFNKKKADYTDCLQVSTKKDGIQDRYAKSLAYFTKKDFLAKILQNENFYPTTYIIKNNIIINPHPIKEDSPIKWFLKPNFKYGADGIQIISNNSFENKTFYKLIKPSQDYVLQAGIEPSLIDGKKFDIRLYVVAIIRKNIGIEYYLYHDGYCRITMQKYKSNQNRKNVNITNMCFAIKDPNFDPVKNPVFILFKKWKHYSKVFPEIKRILGRTTALLTPHLDQTYNGLIVLGFDVILDKDLKPYVIEVNNKLGSKISKQSKEGLRLHQEAYGAMIDTAILPLINSNNKSPKNNGWIKLMD